MKLHTYMLSLFQPNRPVKKVKKGKKVAPAPLKKKEPKKPPQNPLFEKRPRNFGIGKSK